MWIRILSSLGEASQKKSDVKLKANKSSVESEVKALLLLSFLCVSKTLIVI